MEEVAASWEAGVKNGELMPFNREFWTDPRADYGLPSIDVPAWLGCAPRRSYIEMAGWSSFLIVWTKEEVEKTESEPTDVMW